MKLRYFRADRYRSLKEFEVDVDDFMVIVGPNNCGKSNFFYALDLFFSSSVRGVDEESFFLGKTDHPMLLTARFSQLTSRELEKLGPWTVDGCLTVSKEYVRDESGKITASYYALMNVPSEPWLDEEFEDYNNRDVVGKLPIGELLPEKGRITKEAYKQAIRGFKQRYPEQIAYEVQRRKNPAGYKQVLDGYMPEFYLVPAVREATEETKMAPSAFLGRLMSTVVRRIEKFNPAFEELRDALDGVRRVIEGEAPGDKVAEIRDLERSVEAALSVWDVRVDIRVDSPDPERVFQLGTSVMLDDGLLTDVESKGHGLQRALIFALMRVWAAESRLQPGDEVGASNEYSSIFAFEEPELFLHPQLCRATYEALKDLSESEQMLLCTHSAHFVNLEDYRSLTLVTKETVDEGTRALRVSTDLFEGDQERKRRFNMIRYFNPDRNEVFFARKVVLMEGATEKFVIHVIARRLDVFDHRVSLIDCGGKFSLVLYMKVLNAFRIPYLTIYDEDPIPKELEPGMSNHDPDKYDEAKRRFAENTRVEDECNSEFGRTHMVHGDFESALGVSRSHGEKVGKPYAAVEQFSDEGNPITAAVGDLVKEVYNVLADESAHQSRGDVGGVGTIEESSSA